MTKKIEPPTLKSKRLMTDHDEELLIQARKILFKNGVNCQQVISFFFHLMAKNDERTKEIIKEAGIFYNEKLTDDYVKKFRSFNNDSLYDLIEKNKTNKGS